MAGAWHTFTTLRKVRVSSASPVPRAPVSGLIFSRALSPRSHNPSCLHAGLSLPNEPRGCLEPIATTTHPEWSKTKVTGWHFTLVFLQEWIPSRSHQRSKPKDRCLRLQNSVKSVTSWLLMHNILPFPCYFLQFSYFFLIYKIKTICFEKL